MMCTWASLGEKIHEALEEARALEAKQECIFDELHVGETRAALEELLFEKRLPVRPMVFEDLDLSELD